MSAHKTSVGPSGDRSDANDAGLPGSDDVRQAAPPNTLHDTAVLLENRLRNLAYLCAKGRSVTPGMIGPIVREYADDLKAALAS